MEKLGRIPALPESKAACLSTLQEREQRRKDRHHPLQGRQHVGVGGHRHPAESFVLLSQSQIAPPASHDAAPGIHRSKTTLGIGSTSRPTKSSSGKQNITASLLSLLTSRTPHDHPLCADCAKALQDTLQSRLEDVQRERDAYISFERNFQDTKRRKEASSDGEKGEVYEGTAIPLRTSVYDTFSSAEFQQLKQYKARLETQNATLLARLAELEAESEAVAAEEREVDEEDARLAEEEREFLIAYQQVEQDIHGYEAQLATEKTLHLLATQTLQRLESANVYNDVFQIGHVPLNPGRSSSTATGQAGHTGQTVGTINGLRLGGRPVVEWAEINAALGLVALCIDRMAVKVRCTFETYVLI